MGIVHCYPDRCRTVHEEIFPFYCDGRWWCISSKKFCDSLPSEKRNKNESQTFCWFIIHFFFFFFLISIIKTTHSFSGTHKQSHHFEKLEGEDWAAWNSKCNSSILAILTSLNLQIHVMYCRTAKFFTFMTHSVIKDKICIVFFKIQIGHKQLLEVNIRLEITCTKSTCYVP